jgi:hypothetical protein
VEVEADEVDAQPLQPVEPLVERAGAVAEPGVVLDPEADAGRCAGRRHGGRERDDDYGAEAEERKQHRGPVPRHRSFDTYERAFRRRAFRRFTAGTDRTAAIQT